MITAYRWESNWKITALVVIAIPLLLRLGFWQLSRAEEKQLLQQHYIERSGLPPLTEAQLQGLPEGALAYRDVVLEGRYNSEQTVLLDNQINNGRAGYNALTPFITDTGQRYWVNRGWIAGYADRRLPTLPAVGTATLQLRGSIYVPLGETVVLQQDSWPQLTPFVVQSVDTKRLASHFGEPNFDYTLRLAAEQFGALTIDWPLVNTGPEKHLGYALQWFFMAVAVLGFWLYSSVEQNPDNYPTTGEQ
jgi:cytochrome oxidase assembly protein ShyY1